MAINKKCPKKKGVGSFGQKRTILPCNQKKCGFLNNGCQECSECHAKPNMVDCKCVKCYECEFREGEVRWGDKQHKAENKVIQINRQPIIMVVAR